MRIALFGGSFDPPHLGHTAIAHAAQQALSLDRVLFAPVALQPFKPAGPSASFADRVAMTRLAIADQPGFEVTLLDAAHEGSLNPASPNPAPNYTFDTLTRLRESAPPSARLFLLLGADSFRSFPRWHRAAEIPFLADLIVASRPAEDLTDLPSCLPASLTLSPLSNQPAPPSTSQATQSHLLTDPDGRQSHLHILPNLHYDISATQLRHEIASASPTEPSLLAPTVFTYIHQHHLYL